MRNLRVLLLEDGSRLRLREAVAERGNGQANVHVVAPAHVGPLEWLATDEDEARAEAAVRAFDAEWTLTEEAEVEAETGDVDPVLAVEDALRRFPPTRSCSSAPPARTGVSKCRFGASACR